MSVTSRLKAAVDTGRGAASAWAADRGIDTETTFTPDASPSGPVDRAQASAKTAVSLVVALMVGGLVAAFLLPVAIDEIVAVDTSSWGSGASSLWDIMDLIVVLAVFLFFIGVALSATDRL